MDTERFSSALLDIGESMLIAGAEISRVEDTIMRICRAYHASRAEVFTITTVIILTVGFANEHEYTSMRQVGEYKVDLEYLNDLNAFSRHICKNPPALDELVRGYKRIEKKPYSEYIRFFTHALLAFSFSLYSGGSAVDSVISAVIGIMLAAVMGFFERLGVNKILKVFCASFFSGAMAALFIIIGLGDSVDNIIIGNVMSLVPGLALTNSVRDMINEDIVSGLMRFSESLFIAVAIAAGFAMSLLFFGM